MCNNKKCAKNDKLYIFQSPPHGENAKKCAICYLLFKDFHRAIQNQIPKTGSRYKYQLSREMVK